MAEALAEAVDEYFARRRAERELTAEVLGIRLAVLLIRLKESLRFSGARQATAIFRAKVRRSAGGGG